MVKALQVQMFGSPCQARNHNQPTPLLSVIMNGQWGEIAVKSIYNHLTRHEDCGSFKYFFLILM